MTEEERIRRLATDLAVKQALRDKEVNDTLGNHERKINKLTEVTDALKESAERIEKKIDTAAAVAEALANRTMSNKTFFLGCAGVVVSLGAILAGTGHV